MMHTSQIDLPQGGGLGTEGFDNFVTISLM